MRSSGGGAWGGGSRDLARDRDKASDLEHGAGVAPRWCAPKNFPGIVEIEYLEGQAEAQRLQVQRRHIDPAYIPEDAVPSPRLILGRVNQRHPESGVSAHRGWDQAQC